MSNVVRFPGRRYAPPAPTADTLAEELTTLEIEIARIRLEQIRSEHREAEAQRWLKRILAAALLLWLASLAWPAKADSISKSFYDQQGRFAGSSIERGNSTSFYNGRGSFDGSSIRHGNSTSFYDRSGRYTGSVIDTSRRR